MASQIESIPASLSEPDPPRAPNEYERYRAVSASAVGSLILGVLSIVALVEWILAVVPLLGIVLGTLALVKIRRHRDELTGAVLARVGVVLSLLFWVGGWSWMTFAYLTEVPEGYERMTWSVLQLPADAPPAPNGTVRLIPASADDWDQKRVFVKGYVFPGAQRENLREFVLVPDRGTCCFGGQPKLTDMILVRLVGPEPVDFSLFQRKLAGTFKVNRHQMKSFDKVGGVVYELEADYVR